MTAFKYKFKPSGNGVRFTCSPGIIEVWHSLNLRHGCFTEKQAKKVVEIIEKALNEHIDEIGFYPEKKQPENE
jgi:hypothetical protein